MRKLLVLLVIASAITVPVVADIDTATLQFSDTSTGMTRAWQIVRDTGMGITIGGLGVATIGGIVLATGLIHREDQIITGGVITLALGLFTSVMLGAPAWLTGNTGVIWERGY